MKLTLQLEDQPPHAFDQTEISVGRSPAADFRLPPDEVLCASGIHFRLLGAADRWRLAVTHRNGVTLIQPGQPPAFLALGEQRELAHNAELIIGRNGPRLRIAGLAPAPCAGNGLTLRILTGRNSPWTGDFDQDEVTIGRAPEAHVRLDPQHDVACARGIHARLLRRDGRWRLEAVHHSGLRLCGADGRERPLAPGAAAPLDGALDFLLGASQLRLRAIPAAAAAAPLPLTCEARDAASVELPGGVPWSDRSAPARRRLARRQVLRRAAGAGVGLALLAIGLTRGGPSRPAEDRLRAQLDAVRPSVFAVGVKTDDGSFRPGLGTAWVVAPGKLATNGHVADGVEEQRRKGAAVVARRMGAAPVDFPIVATRTHPGWKRWRFLDGPNFLERSGRGVTLAPIFDVALLTVEGDVGPALPCAAVRDLPNLSENQVVGSIGFPTENISGLKSNFPAVTSIGRISSLTDLLGEAAAPAERRLIQHTVTISGGASGSPLLDERGVVIGLVNAGNIVFTDGGRVSVGLNIAQRVDLLAELLAGQAERLQPPRDQELQAELARRLAEPQRVVATAAAERLHAVANKFPELARGALVQVQSWTEPLAVGAVQARILPVELHGPACYIAAAYADDYSDVDLEVIEGAQRIGSDTRAELHATVAFQLSGNASNIALHVYADERRNPDAKVTVCLYLIKT